MFNNHKYSNSTTKHQYKVSKLLEEIGVHVDITVNTRASLGTFDSMRALLKGVEEQKLKDAAFEEEKRLRCLIKGKQRRFQKKMNAQGLYSENQWYALKNGAGIDSYTFKRASRI